MATFTIEEIELPESMDDARAMPFAEAIEVGNAVEELAYGTPDLAYEPAEELPHFRNPNQPIRMLAARVDGRVVARALYETQVGDGADAGWLAVEVLPEHRGAGIGRVLADAVESLARDDHKAKALAYASLPDADGERLASPTGFGSVSTGSREARFLLERGYRLEQIERVSRMPLPVPDLHSRLLEAQHATGDEYAVRLWEGPTPERWRADLAVLATRMSTDAPSAGLEAPEDVWTVERIIEADARNAQLNPRRRITAAAEHLASGTLVGYTVFSVPRQRHRAVDQYATLVLREHRGHRLGMLLKLANLMHLTVVAAGHPAVITFNAEENRHMLDTNEALGFMPIAHESAWRLDL